MEKPLIILIDAETGTVNLFGAYDRQFSIQDAYLIKPLLENRSVIWISDCSLIDGETAMEMIASLAEQIEDDSLQGEPLYLRSLKESYRRVPDVKLTFSGPKDAKALEKLGYDIFDRSPMLREMWRNGEVEILTESEARALRKPKKDLLKAKNDQLDSILIDNHEKAGESENIFTDENEVNGAEDAEVLTEAEEVIRRLGNFRTKK